MIPPFSGLSGGQRLRLGKRGGGGAAPFTPASLSGLVHWMDPSQGVTATANRISAIASQAAGSLDWSQGTAASQPLFEAAGGPNSKPSVYFSSSRPDFLTMATGLATACSTAGECFLIVKADVDPPAANKSLMSFGSNGLTYFDITNGEIRESFGSSVRNDGIFATAGQLASWNTINIWSASNDWAYNINGVNKAVNAVNTVAFPGNPTMGKGALYFDGRIALMLIYSRKLATAERAQVAAWILANYGI